MANRVSLDTDGLKVSKPGVNVLTATSPYDFLILSTNTSLGGLQTGVLTSPQSTSLVSTNYVSGSDEIYFMRDNHAFILSGNVPLTNSTDNVPLVLIQRIDGAGAYGGGTYKRADIKGHKEFQTVNGPFGPIAIEYDYVYLADVINETKGLNGFVLLDNTEATILSYDYTNDDYRYSAFYTPWGEAVSGGGGSNVVVQPLNFNDPVSANQFTSTVSRTIATDVPETASIRFTFSSLQANQLVEVYVNTTGFEATSGTTLTVNVNNGDDIYCYFQDTSTTRQADLVKSFTVTNLSDDNTVIDNFTMEINDGYVPPSSDLWTPAANNDYTETDTQNISGATGSSRTLNLDNSLSGVEYVMIFVNSAPFGPFKNTNTVNFTASNGDAVKFGFYTGNGYTIGGDIDGGDGISTHTMSYTGDVPSNAISYNDLIGTTTNSFISVGGNSQTFSITGTKTFKVIISGGGSTDISIITSGATSTQPFTGTSGSFTFTADSTDSVSFSAFMSGSFSFYSGTAKVYVIVNGYEAYLDEFYIDLETEGGGGPGGGGLEP